jgi:hypothetical protein
VSHLSTTTRKSTGSRSPAPVQLPDRRVEVAKGIAAFLGTALVVVGLPVLLLSAFGTPWPDESPRVDWLTEPTTSDVVLGVLAVVVWLAWAHFVVCLAVEAVAERRHRGLAPHVPGGGIGTQTLARRAVATILLIASTSAVGMGTASAVATPAQEGIATSHAVTSGPAVAGAHAAREAAGNASALPSLAQLDRATKADVADGLTTYYDVKPPNDRRYDTLWDIAERYLGDGLRYKEIWEMNKDVTQPDGRQLRNADLIYPGWVMKLPNDATGAGLKVVDHARGVAPAAPSTEQSRFTDRVPDQTGAEAGAATAAATVEQQSTSFGAWSPFFGVTGGLALAGAVLGLRRRKASYSLAELWAARTSRGSRPDPSNPTPDGDGAGPRLTQEAEVSTAAWIDRALRSWNSITPLPAPSAVSLGAAGLAVRFEEEPRCAPPRGWSSHGSLVWTLAGDAKVDGSGPAPLPGLVTIGRDDDGAAVFVDPESTPGIVSLDGPDRDARGVALSMAVDTGTHPWADDRLVTLVGFADDVTAVGQGRIRRTSDLGRVLERLQNLAAFQRRACREAGAATVRDARVLRPDLDWTYHLVLCSGVPSLDEMSALTALAADPLVALGVVVVGSLPDAAVRLTARADGRLVSPLHGIDVTAQVLDVQAGRELAALYDVPAATSTLSLDDLVDALESTGSTATDAVVNLGILGPVTVDAPGTVDADRRDFLTELGCFIALHPTGVHVNRISAALWPRGVEPEVRDAALQQLVTWWGPTADGAPVLAHDSGVWSLAPGALSLDWDVFRDALNRAANDGRQRERHLRSALDQVRGSTLDGVPLGRYAWVAGTTLESDTALAVAMTTQALAESAVARDDVPAARARLDRALELLPANEDLWRSRLQLEAGLGDREALRLVADRMYAAISEHGSPVGASPQTDALVDELVPGYRTRAA